LTFEAAIERTNRSSKGPLKSYYCTGGNLYSMAFNSSTPTPLSPFVYPGFTQEVT